jgi:hypothetical protein
MQEKSHESKIKEIKSLFFAGLSANKIAIKTGYSKPIVYIICRNLKEMSFGCLVCGGKASSKGMCQKHYYRYYLAKKI